MIFFIISALLLSFYTLLYQDHLTAHIRDQKWLFVVPVLLVLLMANIPRQVSKENYGYGFISSAVMIALFLLIAASGLFPNMLYSSIDEAYSLTLYNSSASEKSLGIMLTIAFIAIPLVGIYTSFVFWTFRGKVELDETSY